MCGIAGIFHNDPRKPVNKVILKRMSDFQAHRGPDDDGFHVQGPVGLAHRRLSIIDLSGGHQPIYSADGKLCIVFNGEIYNHEELQAELKAKGYVYKTRSDTETILHAYDAYGVDCVKRLRGMFAFCIFDGRKNLAFMARDRAGKKPLYYYQDGERLIFASEIQAILKSGFAPRRVDRTMVDFYMSVGYLPGPRTLVENIRKLEPAHGMVWRPGGKLEIFPYWDVASVETKEIPYEEACAQLKDKLLESIRIRLMSEVPLGVFLSGGLDSSIIVGLMSRLVDQPIKTFSVGYENEPESNELAFAKMVSDAFKTEHHEFYLTPDDLYNSIDLMLEHCGEPLVESAGIALYKLAKLAKPQATVILSGEGADEILAGYPVYARMPQLEWLHRLVPSAVWRGAASLVDGRSEKLSKYLDWAGLPFEERFRSLSYDLSETIKKRMFTEEFRRSAGDEFHSYFRGLHGRVRSASLLKRMMYVDMKSWLPEDILFKADRMTMAASIEMRAPFLDHELMEFCLSLPDRYLLRGWTGKAILRDVVKDILPETILTRKKKGFPVPLTSWFRGELLERTRELLLNPKTISRGYFQRGYVEGLFRNIAGGHDLGRRIFSLVVLELWHRKYMDGPA